MQWRAPQAVRRSERGERMAREQVANLPRRYPCTVVAANDLTEGVIMTSTADTAASSLAIPAPKAKAPRRFRGWSRFTVAALVLLAAAVALTVWALTTSSSSSRIQPGTAPV